jgi:tetratricopeptide (TPR) repeat protein
LLKTARKRVVSELADRPELAVELMTAIGYSMLGQGQTADAHALMHDAVELSAQQLGPRHALTTAALAVYGEALVELGQNAKAIAVLAPAIDAALSDRDVRTLITALRWTSSAQLSEGQIDQAVESARKAVAALSMKGGRGKPLTPVDAMDAHQSLANTLNYASKAGAADAAKRALVLAREIYGQRIVQPVLEIRTLFAHAAIDEGQVAEGLRELENLLPDVIGLLGPKHPKVAMAANIVGSARLTAGDVRGAIEALRQGVAITDALREPDSEFNRGAARVELARAYAVARQPADALVVLEEAASLLKTGAGPNALLTLQTLSARASQLAEAGHLAEADAEFKKLESAGWSGPYLASNQARLAALRSLQGRHEEAAALAKLANDELAKVPRKRVHAGALALLGNVRLNGGDARNALEPLQNARSLYAETEIGISPDHAETLVALGRAQLALGDMNAAAQSLAMADKFWQAFDPANRHAGLAKLYLAQATLELGDKGAAAQALRQAGAVLDHSVFPADRALLASTRRRIAPH